MFCHNDKANLRPFMPASSNEIMENIDTSVPVARIEAQDSLFITPLREYLERFGCKVVVNKESSHAPLYVMGVGDAEYVKAFFERSPYPGSKKLGIVYEGDESALNPNIFKDIKICIIDAKPLNQQATREIFAFFFTGRAKSMNTRKGPTTPKIHSAMPTEAQREPLKSQEYLGESDKKRISQTMQQIFRVDKSKHHRTTSASVSSQIGKGVVFVVFCLFVPIVLYWMSLFVSASLLGFAGKFLIQGNTSLSQTLVSYSTSYLNTSRTLLNMSSPLMLFLGQGGVLEDNDRFLTILYDISKIENGVIHIFGETRDVAGRILFPAESTAITGVSDVIKLSTEVTRVSQHLGLISAQVQSLAQVQRFPFKTKFISGYMDKAEGELSRIRGVVGNVEKLLTIYPRIGGFRRKQTYLVLLQNSMELRPTGGFIGSVLLATFLDGRMENLEVQDVYTADGQLKGHIDPPFPIREILGSEHWYLRDSNWDPDFSVSGKQAAWFYEKEMNVPVDGVIAISLPMVTKLLEISGPIELLDFNERISASNFFAKSLLYTQTDFFPGSTQKKDFLGALVMAILTRITTDKTISSGALLKMLTDSMESKDMQFYFPDKELEALTKQWGWTGGVNMEACEKVLDTMPCIGDGVGLVEANLGVNKINFFITREVLSQVAISDDGSLEHTLTYNIRNTAEPQADGGGVYQLYLRALVPKGTNVQDIVLDGNTVPARDIRQATPPRPSYFLVESNDVADMIHIPIAVPPGQVRQLRVRWTRPGIIVAQKDTMYQLTLRKQPGVEKTPWHIVFTFPSSWSAFSEGSVANPGSLEYNTDLTKDESMRIVLRKNL